MSLRVIDHGHEFHVHVDFNSFFRRNLDAVKSIEPATDRRFVNDEKAGKKYWWVSGRQRDHVLLWEKTHHATILSPENLKPEEIGELPPIAELQIDLPLKDSVVLRPYQKQGIAQGMKFGKCLIGDEQGLGKTLEAIGVLVGIGAAAFPCLVVCPASTKMNWQREWHKFSHKRAMILDSSMSAQQRKNWFSYVNHGMVDVVIINYESLSTFCVESYPQEKTKAGKRKPWKAADAVLKPFMSFFKSGILDESHRCKDKNTMQSKFILKIFHFLEYRLLLSGTPVVNKPVDLFPQLAIMGTLQHFGGRDGFMKRYCEGGSGANNLRELNYKMNLHCFFRREKKDVAKDLPEKMRQTILCDITTRSEYNRCLADFQKFLKDSGLYDDEAIARRLRGEIMTKMMQLKQISARGKMNEVKEFVSEVLEAGEKLILFCHLHEIVDECKRLWPEAVTITGRDDMKHRQANIDRFQTDPTCQLIICNHKAAGVGITLTASSRVAFIEYPWHYADCVQCEDRAHRIGQVNAVMCTYFLGQNTVDERMWEIILEKMSVGNTITGASDQMEMEMIDKTFQLFKNE
jgi:SWI/SNF-related matrix-associated actin-dependent regulator 1 of chromatin subfamily A